MKKLLLTLCFLAILPAFAQQANRGWYVGAGVGQADKENADSETMVELFAGYKFGRYFAVEGGYLNYGGFSFSSNTASVDTDISGLKVIALGKLPIGERFVIYGGGGVFHGKLDEDIVVQGELQTNDKNSTGIAGEFGLQFKLTDRWAFDLEYGHYMVDLYNFSVRIEDGEYVFNTDDTSLKSFKLGVSYHF